MAAKKIENTLRLVLGMRLIDYKTTRAYGGMEDESGDLTLVFESQYDGKRVTLEFRPWDQNSDAPYLTVDKV